MGLGQSAEKGGEDGGQGESAQFTEQPRARGWGLVWISRLGWAGTAAILLPWCRAEDGETGMTDVERRALKHLPVNWTEVSIQSSEGEKESSQHHDGDEHEQSQQQRGLRRVTVGEMIIMLAYARYKPRWQASLDVRPPSSTSNCLGRGYRKLHKE